jgi:SAM-dependent methyltransferase
MRVSKVSRSSALSRHQGLSSERNLFADPSVRLIEVAETHFDEWIARRYARLWPETFEAAVLDPTVDLLTELAGAGAALEFGVGTGRVAIPLGKRGVRVCGIELSTAMVDELRRQGGDRIEVAIGDFSSTRVGGTFGLVYLVRNTITNLTTQEEQINAFRNAADHLRPGGRFLVENYIPELQRLPFGETTHVFAAKPDHVAFEEYDLTAQIAVSRHYWIIDGELRTFSSPHRYVWPSELDLMARLAGMTLEERWADWQGTPFSGSSRSHVSIWTKAG